MRWPYLLACILATLSAPALAELRLTIAPTNASPVVGEPVAVLVSLRNAGDGPETVAKRLAPEYGATEFYITNPGGGERRRFSPFALKELIDATQTLAPGASVEDSAELFHDGKEWVFKEPGTYRIEATYYGSVAAEPISLTIAPARTDAERAAGAQLIADNEAGLFLLVKGGENLEHGRQTVQSVADRFPDTAQATHANLVLGAHLSRAAPDFRTLRLRPPDFSAAAARLLRVNYNRLTPNELLQARMATFRMSARLGNTPTVRTLDQRIDTNESRFPAIRDELRLRLQEELRQR